MDQQITLRILLEKPPPGIDFALQSGKRNVYDRVQKQRSGTNDLLFTFSIKVKRNADGRPNFSGPFAQGNQHDRFVYIGIGVCAGDIHAVWNRRLKIPLTTITWNDVEQVMQNPSLMLESRVPGTARDGSPTCATVKPFAGWYVKGA